MSDLISGLYDRIKKSKSISESDSKTYNELVKVAKGLISFVERNPDITNYDIKTLAATNEDRLKYFSVIFHKFPNLVEEIRNNGSKNILDFIETKKENTIYDNYAYELNKCIRKNYINHKNNLTLSITNKYNYNYFKVNFKMSKSELIYTEKYESVGGSSGFVRGVTNITMKEIAQIVGLVSFFEKAKITEETLREIIENNYKYDFSAIQMILDARKSISDELNKDEYSMIRLIDLYNYLSYNKREQQKAELV